MRCVATQNHPILSPYVACTRREFERAATEDIDTVFRELDILVQPTVALEGASEPGIQLTRICSLCASGKEEQSASSHPAQPCDLHPHRDRQGTRISRAYPRAGRNDHKLPVSCDCTESGTLAGRISRIRALVCSLVPIRESWDEFRVSGGSSSSSALPMSPRRKLYIRR